jgi:hypothetical protein
VQSKASTLDRPVQAELKRFAASHLCRFGTRLAVEEIDGTTVQTQVVIGHT